MSNTRYKRRVVLLLLLAVVIVLSVLLFVNSRTAPKSSFIMEGKEKLILTGEVAAVSNSSSIIYCVKDILLEAQGENLRAKNINGSVAWSQKLNGKILKIADAGENIIIIDSQKNINYFSLQGKLLWSYKSQYEITDVFTEDNGSFLVEYKGMTGSNAEVFTKSGKQIGSISVKNAHILSFSTADDYYSISILDISTEAIMTKIINYNFKGDILWAQNFENTIITKLNYINNNKLFALSENTMYIYKTDGSLQEDTKIDGEISSIAINDYIIAIAVHNKGKKYAVCYDVNMREQSRTEIEDVPLGIFPMKNRFIIYNRDELMVITSKGELIALFKSNADISSVYMTSDNKIYLVSNRKLQMLEYTK